MTSGYSITFQTESTRLVDDGVEVTISDLVVYRDIHRHSNLTEEAISETLIQNGGWESLANVRGKMVKA